MTTCAEVIEILEREGVRPSAYCVLGTPENDDQWVLERTPTRYTVYFVERGERNNERSFATEAEACAKLMERVLKYPETRQRS